MEEVTVRRRKGGQGGRRGADAVVSVPPMNLASTIKAANKKLLVDGELKAVGDFFAPGYVAHGTDRELRGHSGVRRYIAMLLRAFPTLNVEVEILLEGESRVAWQRRLSGVQKGSFMGFPATGRRIVWRDMITTRFRKGLIAEDWVITDLAEHLLLARKR